MGRYSLPTPVASAIDRLVAEWERRRAGEREAMEVALTVREEAQVTADK